MPNDNEVQATPPVAAPAPVETPPATPAPPPPAAWPEDWRDRYTASRGGDEKLKNRLSRYSSPESALDALMSVQAKISAGELRSNTPFPAAGTVEQQNEWRRNAGVPEAPDKYQVQLPNGLVVGDDDKPIIDKFLKAAHASNLPGSHVNSILNWYFTDVVEGQQADRHAKDEEVRIRTEEQLRTEWGGDYQNNKRVIEAYLDSGPPGLKDLLFNARLADGTPVASHPDILRFLSDRGRELNPVLPMVPGDHQTQAQTVGARLDALRVMMGNKNSEYWKGPKADKLQAEYRQMLERQAFLAKRG